MFELLESTLQDAQELAEQCFTLTYVLLGIGHPALQESLMFMLLEKQSTLLSLLSTEVVHE